MAQRNHIQTLNARSAVLPSGSEERLERLSISGGDRWVVLFENSSTEEAVWTVPVFPAAYQGNTLELQVLCISTATSGTVTLNAAVEAITSGDALDLDSANSFDSANSGSATVAATAGQLFTVPITLTNKDSLAVGDHVRLKLTRDTSDSASGTLKIVSLGLYEDVASLDLTDFDSVTQPETIVVTADANEVALTVKGATSQVDNLQEWQNNSAATLLAVDKDGHLTFPNSVSIYEQGAYLRLSAVSGVTTNSPLTVPNVATSPGHIYIDGTTIGLGDTGNIGFTSDYYGSATKDLGIIRSAAGVLKVTDGSTGFGSLSLGAYSSSTVGLTVKGAASQSANLQEWQNSSSTVQTKIDKNGYLVINSSASYNNFDTIFSARNANVNSSITYFCYGGDGNLNLFNTIIQLSDGGGVNRAYLAGGSSGGLQLNSNHTIKFGDSYLGNYDSGIKRNAAGILEITNGSSGSGGLLAKSLELTAPTDGTELLNIHDGYGSLRYQYGTTTSPKFYSYQVSFFQSVQIAAIDTVLTRESASVLKITDGDSGFSALKIGSPTSSTVGLTVKGALSQSANLVEYKNSSDTVVGWVNSGGEFVDSTGLANRRRNHIGTVSSSTISFNCQNRFQSVVISGSCTLSVSNVIDGPVCTLRISHAADNATIAWPVTFAWVGGVEPTLSSTNGSVDQITFQWDADLGSFLCSAGVGFAAP